MSQPISFVGKERKEPSVFITEGGLYRMKIVKHEVDGYTNEGNEKHKYSFECNKVIKGADGKPALSTELYTLSNTYTIDQSQEWVFMNLADALKIQTAFDPASLVGYYFMADVEMKPPYNKPDSDKLYANISPYSYKYSVANDSLPPVPPLVVENTQVQTQEAVIDTGEEIPF